MVVFNPNKAYEGAEAEIASFLKVDKEAVAGITGDFSFEITEITRHQKAEMNQELFDKVFGEGVVTSEEEFKNKIKEALQTSSLRRATISSCWTLVKYWCRKPVK